MRFQDAKGLGTTGKPVESQCCVSYQPSLFLTFVHSCIFISHVDVPWSHQKEKHYPSLLLAPLGRAEVSVILWLRE